MILSPFEILKLCDEQLDKAYANAVQQDSENLKVSSELLGLINKLFSLIEKQEKRIKLLEKKILCSPLAVTSASKQSSAKSTTNLS